MELIGSLELRAAELLHHIKIESAVVQGAKNVVKYLSGQKIQDRRILAEVDESACAILLADTVAPGDGHLLVLPRKFWLILKEESSLSFTTCSTAVAANKHTL